MPCRIRSASSTSSAARIDSGPADLAGVRDRAEPRLTRARERPLEQLGRVERLLAAEPDGDDAAVAVLGRVLDGQLGVLERRRARDVRREPQLDAVQLARLLGAVAVAGVELVPADAAPGALDRGEDRLDVHGAVARGLRRVVDGDAPEVVRVPQHVRGHDPDLG